MVDIKNLLQDRNTIRDNIRIHTNEFIIGKTIISLFGKQQNADVLF